MTYTEKLEQRAKKLTELKNYGFDESAIIRVCQQPEAELLSENFLRLKERQEFLDKRVGEDKEELNVVNSQIDWVWKFLERYRH